VVAEANMRIKIFRGFKKPEILNVDQVLQLVTTQEQANPFFFMMLQLYCTSGAVSPPEFSKNEIH
jgi:hypothetical protein